MSWSRRVLYEVSRISLARSGPAARFFKARSFAACVPRPEPNRVPSTG